MQVAVAAATVCCPTQALVVVPEAKEAKVFEPDTDNHSLVPEPVPEPELVPPVRPTVGPQTAPVPELVPPVHPTQVDQFSELAPQYGDPQSHLSDSYPHQPK